MIFQKAISSANDELWVVLMVAHLMERFCHVMYLQTPHCTADKPGLQGLLQEVNMDVISWPCAVLLLQPPFLQPPLFHWAIEAKLRAGQFAAATFCIRLCIKTVVKMNSTWNGKFSGLVLKSLQSSNLKKLFFFFRLLLQKYLFSSPDSFQKQKSLPREF